MRRLELLINEAKLSTNTTDIASISSLLLQGYMNRIHSYVEDLMFLVNGENDLFIADYTFQLVAGQDEYSLPTNIYAKSSIDNLAVSFLNGLSNTYLPLKKVSRKQQGFTFGYFVREDKIVLTPRPTSPLMMKLAYVRKLPTMGIRGAKVDSVTPTTIVVTNYVSGFEGLSDYISIIDSSGTIITAGVEFSFNGTTTFTVASTTGILAGHYIVSGKYASSHSQLPDECEKYLITALERMIQYRQSSQDINTSNLFSSEEIEAIKEVFADNSYDDAKPPVTEWQEWLP
ncbi:MAG: hypothetical protein RIQ94_195 [Pseudomonadota bacterium]|jgi:hypothetical protein